MQAPGHPAADGRHRQGEACDQPDDGADGSDAPVAHDDSPGVLEAQNLLVHPVPFKVLWRPSAA